jgi:hypothetical protein
MELVMTLRCTCQLQRNLTTSDTWALGKVELSALRLTAFVMGGFNWSLQRLMMEWI